MLLSERPPTASSERTNTTWRYDVFGHPRLGKGAMVFTGPDGLSNHRVTVAADDQYVGEGSQSAERTSSARYVWRPAPNAHHPKPKSAFAGSYGWGVTDSDAPPPAGRETPDARIKMNTFRQATEQKVTHLYQNAWYPGPHEIIKPGTDAELVLNVYTRRGNASSAAAGRSRGGGEPPAASATAPKPGYFSLRGMRERMLPRMEERRKSANQIQAVQTTPQMASS